MLSVRCPTCGTALGLPDEMLGQQVRCGGCQEVFVADAPPPPRSRAKDEDRRDDRDDDLPRRRRRDDDDEDDRDRPSSRRRRRDRDDDFDDGEYEDDDHDRPRKKRKRRKKKSQTGQPGLSVAASVLFLIWGGLGAIFTIYAIVGLVTLLDRGMPFTWILNGLIRVVIGGVFSGYLISSGLRILNGEADDLASIGIAVLSVCAAALLLSVVGVALVAPVFALEVALIALVWVLVGMSGVIVGGIFCIVARDKYEKWQRS